ncbi:hypothetical protein PEX1_098040 [Penicillium expansum]|uniref:Aminoglycoside phosphotransferase n=1 Tax=Penicillium expansum TaxID=27334 RepID=A0A0A2KE62_PENEN|nr:hypothetical protein PEX2_071380 [Penicillium expansum]KGO38200.1 hypothetical protein PEXP_101420 [Penicillium expansum]KGO54605.1 hypothetical protein PEX2_071380 [Penicillium expansum]KGO65223.1 hypothetical protein PEX1_098040 [Penicillium expansum]
MNCNQSLDILGKVEEEVWIRRIDQARKDGTLSTWVTTLLPGQASCHLASWAMKGSYNHCQKLFSEDGTAYVLRFPLVSGVSSDCADEKAVMELEAIDLTRKKITIPVPKVHAWGLAKANPLGLGPFILMEFIEGDRTEGFSTTSEYFHHTIHQDQQQFRDQPNSVLEEEEGESNLASLKILEFMIPEIVKKDYDQGPSNMIVRSHDDLTIVGVVDLEWVYAGPAQLFASAPWWLLFDRPTDDNWDVVNGEPPKVATRYFKHLENFKRILDEEEGKIPESQKEFSNLVTWSEESGAMWLHMLVSNGFFGSSTFPCFQLQQNVGVEEWEEQIDEILDQEESIELLAKKPGERELYYKELEKVGECKHWLECEALTKEAFIVSVRKLLAEGPSEEIEEPSLLDRWVRPWF